MIDLSLLERLYKSYGFDVSNESKTVPVFIYRKSRYFGVDIVQIDDTTEIVAEVERVKNNYSQIGFAVNTKRIRTNDEAELELFKSFFSFDSSLERAKRKYADFKRKQTKALLGNEYEYIESPSEIHNHTDGEREIFKLIKERFGSSSAELIIIEAAAGYGKTCTAYEVLNRITNNGNSQIPMFTELARNRAAKIFKYILLDEINSEYPALSYELVTKEIKNGRIPLIIDGFDELIVKTDVDASTSDVFEEVESMLDTIGALLEHKTKIILTTRKTAIFTGVEFENWLAKWNEKFSLTRITIREPRLEDWLGERYSSVKEHNIPIESLSNPVILTFLKNVGKEEFDTLLCEQDTLVDYYFEKMLERERERQNLIMKVEKQMELFKNVVRMLVELDSTIEEKTFFKEIILEQNKKIIEETRALYNAIERPTIEGIVETLSNHALLDRKGREQNQIGFINDFVLGIFIGQIMIESPVDKIEKDFSSNMTELAVTAFRVQNTSNKSQLWEKITSVNKKFTDSTLFAFDTFLKHSPQQDYSEILISDMSFLNIEFSKFKIDSSVFINCQFRSCRFDSDLFHDTSFINCEFEECSTQDDNLLDNRNGVTAIKCKQIHCSIISDESSQIFHDSRADVVNEFEREVLRKLWQISNSKSHHISKLAKSFGDTSRRRVFEAIKSLQEKNYITLNGTFVRFQMNKIHTIKEILEIPND